jgi:eukaryotic-like serine/threonine-protein kinase
MSKPIWDQLTTDELQANIQLRELLFSDPKRAVFHADYLDGALNVRQVLVRFFVDDAAHQEERLSRFLEAKYFEHPNLLRYLETGTLVSNQGTLTYAVTEPGDRWASRSLNTEEALRFAQQVLSALEYLHSRNLVYCVLSPDTVTPVGDDWKLSDFSELRVESTGTSEETLSLSRRWDTCPPEAAEGLISPAWDVWAFGQTLRKVLTGYHANPPGPFRALLLACLNIKPAFRPTLDQLSSLLEMARDNSQKAGLTTAAGA